MPDLLLEFFSEEIPARMQARAAEDLKKLVTDKLVAAGLTYDGAKAFATPRRLALAVAGIPVRQPDIKDERKGPKVGAPEQAIAVFLRAAGLTVYPPAGTYFVITDVTPLGTRRDGTSIYRPPNQAPAHIVVLSDDGRLHHLRMTIEHLLYLQ